LFDGACLKIRDEPSIVSVPCRWPYTLAVLAVSEEFGVGC